MDCSRLFACVLIAATLLEPSHLSLISKSAIVDCDAGSGASLPSSGSAENGGGQTCKKMLLVSMTVKGNAVRSPYME